MLEGVKTATCAPRAAYTDAELAAAYGSVGQLAKVVDKHGAYRCTIRILEVFATTFGAPDPRLVRGEGNGDDVTAFQADHRRAWSGLAAEGVPLDHDTVLIAELFERADGSEGRASRPMPT